jgi:hypothetical protein
MIRWNYKFHLASGLCWLVLNERFVRELGVKKMEAAQKEIDEDNKHRNDNTGSAGDKYHGNGF